MSVQFYKLGRGLMPASEEAEKLHRKMSRGEIQTFKVVTIRDLIAHKRYWKLMEMCADNCERIEIAPNRFMAVHSKDDVHTAIKLCTGYFDTIFDTQNRPMARVVKSISFEEMTPDEWEAYWPRVTAIVGEKILPGVSIPAVEHELQRCMGWAA